ncbi:MAG: signal peptidase II [Oscillospiraceae bacterium]|nr:signal peptidase II [Oscillospiraceae bacterium]
MVVVQFFTVVLLTALDQGTKLWAVKVLEKVGEIPLIEGVFNLRYVENTGAAFSILQGKTLLLTVIPVVACILIIYMLLSKRIHSKTGQWGLVLILSGALGNLIDRIFRGAVVDMFDFELINFPVFNVADICVTVGAVLFFVYAIFFYDKAEKKDE